MKQFCLLFCSLAGFLLARSQDPEYPPAPVAATNITAAEYFIDDDPGFGNATAISVSASTSISDLNAAINISGLSNGVHKLYLRTKTIDGKWSLSTIIDFIVDFDPVYASTPAAAQNIIAAEYFIDNDPGFGNATSISITASTDINNLNATINTTGILNGIHKLYLRTKSANGIWSLTTVKEFLVDNDPPYAAQPDVPGNIFAAEYFIDDDPGFGNATALSISPATNISNFNIQADVTGLTNGVHRFYLRTMDAAGKWTLTSVNSFTIDQDYAYPAVPDAPLNIHYAEYFFDNDPGFGNGTEIAITAGTNLSNISFNANTASLADGPHTFYIRSKNNWSITNYVSFVKGAVLPLQFLQLSAAASGKNVMVNWSTADEVNTSYFTIEFSTDGFSFYPVGNKDAQNSSGIHHYSFEHPNVPKGLIYYRIKQVDRDGRFSYSNIVKLNFTYATVVTLYPNPASNEIRLLHIKPDEIKLVEIITTDGKSVILYSKPTVLQWNIRQLPAAMYRLRIIKTDDTVQTLPFIKQ